MGGCCSGDAAGEKKRSTKLFDANIPDVTLREGSVKLARPIKKAHIGPQNGDVGAPVDVTDQARRAYAEGAREVSVSTIDSVICDPFPGEAKVLFVWYFPEAPDAEWEDFENVELKGDVACATYGFDENAKEVTATVNAAIAALREKQPNSAPLKFIGGVHSVLKEPLPSDPNKFKVWY